MVQGYIIYGRDGYVGFAQDLSTARLKALQNYGTYHELVLKSEITQKEPHG